MIEFDPILNSQDLTGVSILPEWPKTRDGVAIVLIDNTGELFSLKLGEQASFDEILLSNLDRYFLVDTSQHVFSFISDLPLSFRAYSLEAAINCTFYVENPSLVVRKGIRDIPAILQPAIVTQLKKITPALEEGSIHKSIRELEREFQIELHIDGIYADVTKLTLRLFDDEIGFWEELESRNRRRAILVR